jgi:hypothetical protein
MKAGTQIVKIIMMTVILKNREYRNDHNNPPTSQLSRFSPFLLPTGVIFL